MGERLRREVQQGRFRDEFLALAVFDNLEGTPPVPASLLLLGGFGTVLLTVRRRRS